MKIIMGTLSVVFLALALFFIWLTKPYMDYQSVRLNNPVEVIAEYRSVTGDPLCTKLYVVSSNMAIFPNVPNDVPDPHVTILKDGDHITLVGYTYEWQAKNLITGNIQKRPSGMMDVIAWRGDNLSFATQLKNIIPQHFDRKNYSDCN